MHRTYSPDRRGLELLRLDDPRWARFVGAHAFASPFHEPGWARLLAACYRLDGGVLAEVDASGAVRVGVPVLEPPRLPRRARRLVSLPFTDAVAPLAEPGCESGFAKALDDARARMEVARIEMRSALEGARRVDTEAVIHNLRLGTDADAVVSGFSKSTRRNIRLAERRGIVVRRAREKRDLTEVFYRLHLATRRRLGVPVQPKRFFEYLWQALDGAGLGFVLVAEMEGVPVAAAVFLQNAAMAVYKYSASDASALPSKPNDLVIATAIRQASEAGCSSFDFGRSDLAAEGLRAFKRSFGAEEVPLVYSVVGEPAPVGGRRESAIVRRLLQRSPVWATRMAGEVLYRYAA